MRSRERVVVIRELAGNKSVANGQEKAASSAIPPSLLQSEAQEQESSKPNHVLVFDQQHKPTHVHLQ